MAFLSYFIISILFINNIDENVDKTIFRSPVTIPLALSANFGELRIDHFHSGLDIKTQGVTGKEVVAAADGYIYRIGISPGGFGKALYIRHPSGYSTVYGHLDRFTPEIDKYVSAQQYERRSFALTLFPPADKFRVKQGDLIAYSGNSGASGGPHLHYEIRKSDSEMPVNPLLFEFGTGDDIEPMIDKLVIYPLSGNTLINGENEVRKINVTGGHGNYYIPAENPITISGPAGFGIKAFDLLNDSYNKCAVYSIELRIDSLILFTYRMDSFAFNESRYINSHIDYEAYLRENTYFERTFVLPNDKLSVYKNFINRGIFNFRDTLVHHIEISVRDIHNNVSSLDFKVTGKLLNPAATPVRGSENFIPMPYNRTNRYRTDNISITIPSGALYDTILFTYRKNTGTPQMLSDVHYIHNRFTPVHKPYTLSIRPSTIPEGKASKLLIVQMDDSFKKTGLNSSFTEGYVTAEPYSFGMFFVGIDTVPPAITANGLISNTDLSGKQGIRIRITDELSGIRDYQAFIDGKWYLFEYDQKNDIIFCRFDQNRIAKGQKHSLSLRVTDNRDNVNEFNCDFVW